MFLRKKNKLTLVLIIISVIAFVYFNNYLNPQDYKIYRSKSMNISFEVPSESILEDKFASVAIKKNNREILISRNGTNFNELDSYLSDLHEKNRAMVIKSENLEIDGYESVKQVLSNKSGEENSRMTYFVFIKPSVYNFSTTSEDLYDELDQIAKSFKYTGEK